MQIVLLPRGSLHSIVLQKWLHCPESIFCSLRLSLHYQARDFAQQKGGHKNNLLLSGGNEAFHRQEHTLTEQSAAGCVKINFHAEQNGAPVNGVMGAQKRCKSVMKLQSVFGLKIRE
jgi:hypothetical protein